MLSSGLHATLLTLAVLGLSKGPSSTPQGGRLVAVVTLPPMPEPTAADVIAENQQFDEVTADEGALELPGGEVDIARIRARQDVLFPLLTDGLPELTAAGARDTARRDDALTWFNPGAPSESGLPPLTLSETDLTRIVDAAWSRRERWRSFVQIATLVSEHDPDAGSAADLVRRHVDRNLLQPYGRTSPPDERFWVLLNLAVDQQPIIRFVTRFVREHPGTRVSTELLFLLDELTQANYSTLLILAATEPGRDLTFTRERHPDAHELAVAIHRRYVDVLGSRQLDSPTRIREVYDDIRIRLLTTILETTPDGYGAADARYLLGRVRWNQNRTAEAMDWWRDIQPDSRNLYAPFYTVIVPEVRAPTTATAARILGVLGAERLAWERTSAARLKQFGYTAHTF
jgi:hypothetical protein